MEFLRTVYSQEKESFGFSQKNALRNANLMFIEGKIKDLKRHLSVISDQIVEPLYRFSLDSLYRRIARLESADIPEEMRALQARQGYSATAKLSSTTKTSTGQISAVPETDPEAEEKKNATFDFSDLMFATPEDLGAYQAIYQEFNKVLDNNPNMSVKRWLYKQIDDVADEMFAKESSAISAQAFSRTREGRGLIDKMNQLEQEILAEDRKNAVRYQGEQERFNRDFNLANNREQKLAVLQNYIHKWNRIANDDNTSLEVQGAFHAFGGTAEGRDLKKQIYGLVQEFNLIPPSLLIEQEFLDELEL